MRPPAGRGGGGRGGGRGGRSGEARDDGKAGRCVRLPARVDEGLWTAATPPAGGYRTCRVRKAAVAATAWGAEAKGGGFHAGGGATEAAAAA